MIRSGLYSHSSQHLGEQTTLDEVTPFTFADNNHFYYTTPTEQLLHTNVLLEYTLQLIMHYITLHNTLHNKALPHSFCVCGKAHTRVHAVYVYVQLELGLLSQCVFSHS